MGEFTIRTSEPGWFKRLAQAYKNRESGLLIDDANVGIDPSAQSLVGIGIKAGLSTAEWIAVGVSLGVSAAGILMVVLAFVDPEPTSKLGLLVGGGAVCVLTGGLSAVRVLTKLQPPTVEASAAGVRISWK